MFWSGWIWQDESRWQTLGSQEQRKALFYWTCAAIAVPTAAAIIWWITENSINRLAPYQVSLAKLLLQTKGNLVHPYFQCIGLTFGHKFEIPNTSCLLLYPREIRVSDSLTIVLLQYHYRPGTVTSFLSRILDRHAKRRRGNDSFPPRDSDISHKGQRLPPTEMYWSKYFSLCACETSLCSFPQ